MSVWLVSSGCQVGLSDQLQLNPPLKRQCIHRQLIFPKAESQSEAGGNRNSRLFQVVFEGRERSREQPRKRTAEFEIFAEYNLRLAPDFSRRLNRLLRFLSAVNFPRVQRRILQ